MVRLAKLARLTAERALGLNRTLRLHILLGVVDVVLALSTLLGRQSLAELALGLIFGCLILLGFLIWLRFLILAGFHD